MEAAKLSKDQREAVIKWITEKAGDRKITCTVCGASDWAIPNYLGSIPIFDPKRGPFSTARFPHVLLGCTNCGHTLFLNSVVMGITERPPKQKKPAVGEDAEKVAEQEGGDGDA